MVNNRGKSKREFGYRSSQKALLRTGLSPPTVTTNDSPNTKIWSTFVIFAFLKRKNIFGEQFHFKSVYMKVLGYHFSTSEHYSTWNIFSVGMQKTCNKSGKMSPQNPFHPISLWPHTTTTTTHTAGKKKEITTKTNIKISSRLNISMLVINVLPFFPSSFPFPFLWYD